MITRYKFLKGHDAKTKEISADGEGEDTHKPDDGGRTFASARNVVHYPTGQKYSLELMFAKFATAKIAKDLNPPKVSPYRCQ